jgi:hypothetical protein
LRDAVGFGDGASCGDLCRAFGDERGGVFGFARVIGREARAATPDQQQSKPAGHDNPPIVVPVQVNALGITAPPQPLPMLTPGVVPQSTLMIGHGLHGSTFGTKGDNGG